MLRCDAPAGTAGVGKRHSRNASGSAKEAIIMLKTCVLQGSVGLTACGKLKGSAGHSTNKFETKSGFKIRPPAGQVRQVRQSGMRLWSTLWLYHANSPEMLRLAPVSSLPI
jgi:hypothetical protein